MAGSSTGLLAGIDRERSVPLRGRITRQIAACCIARLIVLATEHPERPIIIYIDSPGGGVADVLPIVSTIKGIKSPLATFVRGEASGTAAVVAASGSPGCRSAIANAHFSFKPVSSAKSQRGTASDDGFVSVLSDILSEAVRRPKTEVQAWITSGVQFGASEAQTNGLIDSISARPVMPRLGPDTQ